MSKSVKVGDSSLTEIYKTYIAMKTEKVLRCASSVISISEEDILKIRIYSETKVA